MIRITILIFFTMSMAFGLAQDCHIPELIPFKKGGKWGYSNAYKRIVIPAKYDEALLFNIDDLAKVKVGTRQLTINKEGKEVEAQGFEEIGIIDDVKIEVSDDKVVKAKNGKFKLMRDRKVILDSSYDYIKLERENLSDFAIVKHSENGWGIFDLSTNQVAKMPGYDSLSFSSEPMLVEEQSPLVLTYAKGKMGWRTLKGREIAAPQYDNVVVLNSNNSFLAVSKDYKWALATLEGKLVTGFKFDAIGKQQFNVYNLFLVRSGNNGNYYIDCKGTEYFEN